MIVICYRRIGNRKNGSFTNETKNKRRIIYYEENRAESCSCCSDAFGLVAAAEGIVPYGNPDTTLDNPQSLPYSSSFSFKEGSTTNDAYLTTNRTAKISIKAYYWNGSTWKSSDSSSVTINNTKADYSVTLSVSANKPLYVRLSKTDYTGYYAKGTLTIE